MRQTCLNVPVYTLFVYVCTVQTSLVYLLYTCLSDICESGLWVGNLICVLRYTPVPDRICVADTVCWPKTGLLYALYTRV